mgnify:CR=1 FL=1
MTYNIIDILSKDLTDKELKEIINRKLFSVIEITEFNVKFFEEIW